MKHRIHYINLALFAGGLLLAGCVGDSLKSKSVNAGVGFQGAQVSGTPSPQNGGSAFSFLVGSTTGIWQTTPSTTDGSVARNSVLVQRTESSAWYCASVKNVNTAVTITSDSPIVMDWAALMGTAPTQPGSK